MQSFREAHIDRDWLFLGETLLKEAARELLSEKERSGSRALKEDETYVTQTDIRIEKFLRHRLHHRFPGHGIRGEEEASLNQNAPFQWTIDPIDGTHSFVHGIPLFGILLALSLEGFPVMGWIFLPELNLMISAVRGGGLRVNERPFTARKMELHEGTREIIAVGEVHQFEAAGLRYLWEDLNRRSNHVRTYCDCFGHAMAILGRAGCMVDVHLKVWDWQATKVLIQEAGGVFHCRESSDPGNSDLIFGKPVVVERILRDWDRERIVHPWAGFPERA